jgi:hypothetical protein
MQDTIDSNSGGSGNSFLDSLTNLVTAAAPIATTVLKKPTPVPTVAKPAVTTASGISFSTQSILLIAAGALTLLLVVMMFMRKK